jgi:hypothetical protein
VIALKLILLYAALLNLTWIYFCGVMRLRELRDAGKLRFKDRPILFVMAWLNLVIGLLLDALLNVASSVILLELPRYDLKEFLLTARLIRWHHSLAMDWWTLHVRKNMVALGQALLDLVDTDGIHIR